MNEAFWKDAIVYQIYPRSFRDANGDGIGDIPGILEKLDYLEELGVNTLWLSPLYKSPNADYGYDVSDYRAIHPDFGTMADFEELIRQTRARGIRVIMDMVINHTSDEHEWFQRALAGEERYRDYYIIRPGKGGKPPNNWGNFFGQCPWDVFGDPQKGEYYLHLFSQKQPDLNWDNPAVYEEIKEILRFWLEKGVAGFRCDVINVIHKNTLADGKKQLALTGKEHYLSTPGCHDILRQLQREMLEPYGAVTVGEAVLVDLPTARDLCEPSRKELDMIFSFEHMECDQVYIKWFKRKFRPVKLMRALTKWQKGLSWNACYLENHDQPRSVSRFGDDDRFRVESAKMLGALVLTLRGTPFLYQGQEIGMTNGEFESLDDIQDVESHSVDAMAKKLGMPRALRWKLIRQTSRDNARTPMQWDGSAHGGFTDGKPWLPVNRNFPVVNVAWDGGEPNGVFAFYQRMIEYRKGSDILKEGDFRELHAGGTVYAFQRSLAGRRLVAAFNFSSKPRKLPIAMRRHVVLSNYEKSGGDILRPYEFRLTEG